MEIACHSAGKQSYARVFLQNFEQIPSDVSEKQFGRTSFSNKNRLILKKILGVSRKFSPIEILIFDFFIKRICKEIRLYTSFYSRMTS